MKKIALFRLLGLFLVLLAFDNGEAGSVVATDSRGHNIYVFGHPEKQCEQLAFELARSKGLTNERIIAATDTPGYGAIAVALHPNGYGSMLGVSLGNRSAGEARMMAIDLCRKAGGTHIQVKWSFRG